MDVRFSRDYFSEFIRLGDLDLRMPYYNYKNQTTEQNDIDNSDERRVKLKFWYLCEDPDINYVYNLRNLL